ncbi:MAG: YihY/virulence factor BrkB family protein [Oligosphaeraceae bacterium]|nr:YihY/virulence factor BrkB family protein [Oligosphaeraceae bacterium]
MSIVKNISSAITDGKRFFLDELWASDLQTLPALRRFVFSLCRIGMIVGRDFQRNKCSLQASALTYITLISMVPILAIMFAFSKGLGMQNRLMNSLGLEQVVHIEFIDGQEVKTTKFQIIEQEETTIENMQDKAADAASETKVVVSETDPDIPHLTRPGASQNKGQSLLASNLPKPMQQVLVNIFSYVEKTSFATLGLVGSLTLLGTVIISMSKLESNFNTIWGQRHSRPLPRKISEYLVVLILMPIVFLAISSLNAVISSNKILFYLAEHTPSLAWIIRKACVLLLALFVVGGFSFFYIFMPNTKVKPFPALAAGLVAGALWFAVYWAYIVLQVGLTKYNTIYGTFAAFPFFLGWLYANWSIILIGAEISFAVQNYRTMHWEKVSEHTSPWAANILGILVLLKCSRSLQEGAGGWEALEYARENDIPTRVMRYALEVLQGAGLIIPVFKDNKEEQSYLPGRMPEDLNLAMVEEAFRKTSQEDAVIFSRHLPEQVNRSFEQFYAQYQNALAKQNFKDLLDTTQE